VFEATDAVPVRPLLFSKSRDQPLYTAFGTRRYDQISVLARPSLFGELINLGETGLAALTKPMVQARWYMVHDSFLLS
jgi:hypothetical protein